MDAISVVQSPFAVMTFIAAPALLTNASSLLAMSTTNRMLRTRDRMAALYAKSEKGGLSESDRTLLLTQTSRAEKQALLILSALHSVYVALGSFAGATLVTLIGAGLDAFHGASWFKILAALGLLLGAGGVGSLVFGSIHLFQATRLSLVNIREEAGLIRKKQAERDPAF